MPTPTLPLRLPCVAALALACSSALAACPPPPRLWVERVISADCLACWQASAPRPRSGSVVLDWIVPTNDDAALATAALTEAAERFPATQPDAQPAPREQPLPATGSGPRLSVSSGLAWNGYIGLGFELNRWRRPSVWPEGSQGWVALVERIPAGADGSGVARQLVRAVAGPLVLPQPAQRDRLHHLVAVRLPASAQPERLAAVGWVQAPGGQVLLAAQSAQPGCKTAR